MKKVFLVLAIALISSVTILEAQSLKGLKKKLKDKISTSGSGLSEEEIGNGLKEALNKGVEKGVAQVSKPDGYFKDEFIKILMPEEAKKVEDKLRKLGQDKLVDDAIESMNRAAEDAAKSAKDIFVDAIRQMTIQDAVGILKGEDDAATQYLNRTTNNKLNASFQPIIKTSLDKVGATKHWNAVISAYNKIPFVDKVNPDLDQYVTEKAIEGLFVQVAKEEKEIRENPAARTSDLLKKVFGQ
ncbi:MAG: DUF4197 domain-containing protein [Bacteroidota bacterium]